MRVGTKSVLFGVHCPLVHTWFVAWAWWKLYGFPWDPRLWVAFFVHDLGYWGKPNMDGPEGEDHVWLGAHICGWLFDWDYPLAGWTARSLGSLLYLILGEPRALDRNSWFTFCFYHSRYRAKLYGVRPSALCVADKLAIALTPAWLYLPAAWLSGELWEYLERAKQRAAANEALSPEERQRLTSGNVRAWHTGLRAYMRRWVEKHKDGGEDTWTPSRKAVSSGS